MTAEEIKSKFTCIEVLASNGHPVNNPKRHICCPFHKEKTGSLMVYPETNSWKCYGCNKGGDVIALLAEFDGIDCAEYLRRQNQFSNGVKPVVSTKIKDETKLNGSTRLVATYVYHDANGNPVFKALRYFPKTFRQWRMHDGEWVAGMDGVERVPYRLPAIRKSKTVWIVEGEKDAETMEALGYVATTNVGGAGNWLESYNEHIAGKDVIICSDNDKAGIDRTQTIIKMAGHAVKSMRLVLIPSPHKDITEFVDSIPDDDEARTAIDGLLSKAEALFQGEPLPLKTMEELEADYRAFLIVSKDRALNMGAWLPLLKDVWIVPGEIVVLAAETGVGKSAMLTSLHLSNSHLMTVSFGMELAANKVFTRNAQSSCRVSRHEVEASYRNGSGVNWKATNKFNKIVFCAESCMTLEKMDSIVRRSELKTGEPPAVVFLDYIQLMMASKRASRYETVSEAAEGMKRMAKQRNVVIVIASQCNRDKERGYKGLTLNDMKESGSIENSAGLVLGATRNPDNKSEMCIQVLKGTEIGSGLEIPCLFDFETMLISQRNEVSTGEISSPPPNEQDFSYANL